jgi:hypothetical protein
MTDEFSETPLLGRYQPATAQDIEVVRQQLGREPRGMVAVAARAGASDPLGVSAGTPLVVVTSPRVKAGRRSNKGPQAALGHDDWRTSEGDSQVPTEPFPTTFYLTNPVYASAISRLEANGLMKELEISITSEIDGQPNDQFDESLAKRYQNAHQNYIKGRDDLAISLGVKPLTDTHPDFSAGGMPNRVKCLHALIGHSLATLQPDESSDNPIGDLALKQLYGGV